MNAPESNEIIDFIRAQLGLPPDTETIAGPDQPDITGSFDLPIRPDLIFRDRGQIFVVEIKRSAVTINAIAQLQLYRQLLEKRTVDQVRLVLAAKTIGARESDLARELGILFIRLPWTLRTPPEKEHSSNVKISSEKSWRIVSRLLKEKSTSIRQLALKENISYGWAHKVIEALTGQNIVKKEGGYVTISDVNNLLNGIAWERPFKNLQITEIPLRFGDTHEAAQEITRNLADGGIPFAFAGYTAGGLYTGFAFRQDAVYLYLEKDQAGAFREQFGAKGNTGITAVLYAPDRNVFSDARTLESVRVTSPSQTLLDLAGLGYSAMDLTKALAEKYANL